ncbi:hypothetical protein HBI70_041850 [Parastagonospora nodorum]|nr:hypothetical protein HBI10_009080 [Parastagonospora nodorum]KAH4023618.1 hypothetical protein HBI13_090790 [Parastagonospora nodorum]KAH4420246.1 hypothetical protein HBH92_031590 [Parastagonospora nodorum]KAH4452135.1 hypothetical protein HBH93_029080 [Parastagonospora nodorum]KAH4465995.1 hypothetical protein HBH91_031610 [Parastagonospora nodorum]
MPDRRLKNANNVAPGHKTAQQHSSTAAQQHSSTAAQQHRRHPAEATIGTIAKPISRLCSTTVFGAQSRAKRPGHSSVSSPQFTASLTKKRPNFDIDGRRSHDQGRKPPMRCSGYRWQVMSRQRQAFSLNTSPAAPPE